MNNFPNTLTAGISTNFKQEQPQPEAQGYQPTLFSGMASCVHLSEQDVTQAISALPRAYQQGPEPRPLSIRNVSPPAATQYLPQRSTSNRNSALRSVRGTCHSPTNSFR